MVVSINKRGVMSGPIPGQSWTDEPGKYPYERPPQFTNPNDAVEYLWGRMMRRDTFVSVVSLLDTGVPITHVADTTLYAGVMEGLYTLDVAFIIRDVFISMLIVMCKKAGIKPVLYAKGMKKPGETQLEQAMQAAAAQEKGNAMPEQKTDETIAEVKKATAGLLKKPIEETA